MRLIPRLLYKFVKNTIGLYLRTFLEFRIWGKENIPLGPKIFCSNHFSSTDPFFVITLMKDPVHMVIGPGFSVPFIKFFLKKGEQINALQEYRNTVIHHAVEFLKKGESIYIFPEGDLNDQNTLLKFYNGLALIYLSFPVPVIPIGILSPKRYVKEKERNIKIGEITYKTFVVLRGKFYANIGEPINFEKPQTSYNKFLITDKITKEVRNKIEELINDIKLNKFWE